MLLRCALNSVFHKVNRVFLKHSFQFTRLISNDQIKNPFKVHVIPALKDNYMYLLINNIQKSAIAVDPVEPEKILEFVKTENVSLNAILTTHHHWDHAGGNLLMSKKVKDIPIYGGDERIEALTTKLSHNEVFHIGKIAIKCLHTPCHTSGHVCYYIESSEPICFSGDTLFVGGCGRFFEGSAEQMFKSLNILSALPSNTKIYCGHEYTLNNLKFALSVEPNNEFALKKLKSVEECLKKMEPTVPSTIEEELTYNPFLRANEESVKKYTQQTNQVAVIKALRELKDNFVS